MPGAAGASSARPSSSVALEAPPRRAGTSLRSGRGHRRPWRLVLLAVVAVAVLAGLTREGRTAFRAVALVPYVFPDAPARPLSWVTPAPLYEEARYSDGRRTLVADVYRPALPGRHSAMVLSLGVHPVPRDDPALVRLADGLARDGFVVMIPDSPDLRADRILPSERDAFVAAFLHLRGRPYVDTDRIGLVGFSVGASLLTVAAADPRISSQVRMVNFFGGYYDAVDVLRAIASRQIRYRGEVLPWEPAELARQIFANVLIEHVDDATDRALVRRELVDGRELTTAERERLGDRARLVLDLFTARDPGRVDALIAQLPDDLRERLRVLSPSTYVMDLRARMYVMHDTADGFIPYVESRRLAERLPGRQVVHTEFSIFAHVQPTRPAEPLVFASEVAKLVRHLYLAMLELT